LTMENTTKERILNNALVCFATDGYNGTNLRDFAARLGLSKSALYRHYTSKEDIWNSLLDRMEEHYSKQMESVKHGAAFPNTSEELLSIVMRMVNFTIHDEQIILTRKLLMTEQFHDERANALATEHFFAGIRQTFTEIFKHMIDCGSLHGGSPEMLALTFTAPITELIHYCDREPAKEQEIINEIEAFVRHFISTYGNSAE